MAALNLNKINRTALAERRTHKKISMITTIMLAVAAVLCWMTDSNGLQILGLFLFCVGIGIGVIAGISVFREMTNSQMGDVKLSLPMSNAERFLSRLLTLSYIHIFPMIAFGFIGALGMFLGDGIVDGQDVWQALVLLIAYTFFVDSVTVFCTCCCGALAESIYFSVISIGCLSVVPAAICYRISQSFAGIGDYPNFIKYWTLSSAFVFENSVTQADVYLPNIVSILISCLVFFAAYLIFRKRDARSIGDPIAVRPFFEAIMLIGVFTVYSAFICTNEVNIGLIITAVIYITINIIVSRAKISFKRIMIWLGKLAATTALFMAVVAAGFLTDGFGAYDHLPVRKMTNYGVDINTEYYLNGDYNKEYDGEATGDVGTVTDEDVRDMIKTARKYGKREKTFDRFKAIVFDDHNRYYYDYAYEDDISKIEYACVNIRVYKNYKQGFTRDVMYQTIYVDKDDIEALFNELADKGYDSRITVNDYNSYNDYMDEVVY